MFLGLLDPDPDPQVRGIDPDPDAALVPYLDPDTFFAYYFFLDIFTSFFKNKKSERSRKTIEINAFLTIFD